MLEMQFRFAGLAGELHQTHDSDCKFDGPSTSKCVATAVLLPPVLRLQVVDA